MTAVDFPLVLGTAGHIDHGKTSLVHALTGIDTDRLPVEKARGITTELGFARLDLDDKRLAVVDVPGHERFVKSMAAGAAGLDLVLMVIAADEGLMPQTREHLDICELLGVRRGVVALTKRDLVDDEWLAMVTGDVAAALAPSFLAGAPIVPVSARTGAGLDDLRRALAAAIGDLPPRDDAGVFRLPIDRVFTIRGFGTVVTGTVIGGAIATGDELVVLPRGLATRARGIEVHGDAATAARAGMRAAINLGAVAVGDLARGDVLARPDTLEPSHILDVTFRYLPAAGAPLGRRTRVLVHHAATQVMANLILDRDRVAPGDRVTGQLRLDATTPLVALPGDRFIARGFAVVANHGTTIGGGVVVRVLAARARRTGDHALEVRQLADAGLGDRLAGELRHAAGAGRTVAELARRTGRAADAIRGALEPMVTGGELVAIGEGDTATYMHGAVIGELEARLVEHVTTGVASREEARVRLPHALPVHAYNAIIAGLVRRGVLAVDGDAIRLAGEPAADDTRTSPLEDELVARFRGWALEAPRPKDIPATIGQPEPAVRSALDRLLSRKAIVKIKPDLYVDAGALGALRARLIAHLDARGQITPQEWKELCGSTRKYSIPLAEYFDGEKLTLRIGDVRKRRAGAQK